MRVPTDKAILALHEQHAPTPEALEAVYTHRVIVCGIAEQLHARSGREASLDIVRAGCLLHDVGVYRLYDGVGRLDHANYIRHGVLGDELLAAEGFSEVICRFASHHTGVGLSRDDVLRQELPLPPCDYLAETPEEALVMYSFIGCSAITRTNSAAALTQAGLERPRNPDTGQQQARPSASVARYCFTRQVAKSSLRSLSGMSNGHGVSFGGA